MYESAGISNLECLCASRRFSRIVLCKFMLGVFLASLLVSDLGSMTSLTFVMFFIALFPYSVKQVQSVRKCSLR